MKSLGRLPGLLGSMALLATQAAGQGTALSPSQLVLAIEKQGHADNLLGQLLFEGCPQDDQRGQMILDLMGGSALSPRASVAIAYTWTPALIECGHPPLEDWFKAAMRQVLASDHPGDFRIVLNRLGQHAPESLRLDLWHHLEEVEGWSLLETQLAATAIADASPHEWVRRGVEAFAGRTAPNRWISDAASQLLREHPTILIRTLTQRLDEIPDDRLLVVLDVIRQHRNSGVLGEQAPGINPLRWAVRARPGIPGDEFLGPPN